MSTCHKCAQPAVRSLGTQDWCHHCAEAFLAPLRAKHAPSTFGGVGIPTGTTIRGLHPLHCDQCSATWHGTPHEPCGYCAREHAIALRIQAELVLTAPDDITDRSLNAWADRLVVAVDAGIVTQADADRTWKRAIDARP